MAVEEDAYLSQRVSSWHAFPIHEEKPQVCFSKSPGWNVLREFMIRPQLVCPSINNVGQKVQLPSLLPALWLSAVIVSCVLATIAVSMWCV